MVLHVRMHACLWHIGVNVVTYVFLAFGIVACERATARPQHLGFVWVLTFS